MSVVEFFELAIDLLIFAIIRCRISMKAKRQLAAMQAGADGAGPPGSDDVQSLVLVPQSFALVTVFVLSKQVPRVLIPPSLDLQLHRLGLESKQIPRILIPLNLYDMKKQVLSLDTSQS